MFFRNFLELRTRSISQYFLGEGGDHNKEPEKERDGAEGTPGSSFPPFGTGGGPPFGTPGYGPPGFEQPPVFGGPRGFGGPQDGPPFGGPPSFSSPGFDGPFRGRGGRGGWRGRGGPDGPFRGGQDMGFRGRGGPRGGRGGFGGPPGIHIVNTSKHGLF